MPFSLKKGPTPKTHSFYHGTTAVNFHGSLMWNNLPVVVKSNNSLFEFKMKLKILEILIGVRYFILFCDLVGIF